MDTVYIIYYKGKMFLPITHVNAYIKKEDAEKMIYSYAYKWADALAKDDGKAFIFLNYNEQQKYIEKIENEFEIREFVERR